MSVMLAAGAGLTCLTDHPGALPCPPRVQGVSDDPFCWWRSCVSGRGSPAVADQAHAKQGTVTCSSPRDSWEPSHLPSLIKLLLFFLNSLRFGADVGGRAGRSAIALCGETDPPCSPHLTFCPVHFLPVAILRLAGGAYRAPPHASFLTLRSCHWQTAGPVRRSQRGPWQALQSHVTLHCTEKSDSFRVFLDSLTLGPWPGHLTPVFPRHRKVSLREETARSSAREVPQESASENCPADRPSGG